jgi:hypothetical protein
MHTTAHSLQKVWDWIQVLLVYCKISSTLQNLLFCNVTYSLPSHDSHKRANLKQFLFLKLQLHFDKALRAINLKTIYYSLPNITKFYSSMTIRFSLKRPQSAQHYENLLK